MFVFVHVTFSEGKTKLENDHIDIPGMISSFHSSNELWLEEIKAGTTNWCSHESVG